METPRAGDRGVERDVVPGLAQPPCQAVEVVGNEAGVRLPRGRERILDADVQLLPTGAEPAATAGGKSVRLRELGQPEQAAVERARLVLAARRRRDLHVVDA